MDLGLAKWVFRAQKNQVQYLRPLVSINIGVPKTADLGTGVPRQLIPGPFIYLPGLPSGAWGPGSLVLFCGFRDWPPGSMQC